MLIVPFVPLANWNFGLNGPHGVGGGTESYILKLISSHCGFWLPRQVIGAALAGTNMDLPLFPGLHRICGNEGESSDSEHVTLQTWVALTCLHSMLPVCPGANLYLGAKLPHFVSFGSAQTSVALPGTIEVFFPFRRQTSFSGPLY